MSIPRTTFQDWKLRHPRFGDRSKILAKLLRDYLDGKIQLADASKDVKNEHNTNTGAVKDTAQRAV